MAAKPVTKGWATGQLHTPKFSKTCFVVRYNKKLQNDFAPPPSKIVQQQVTIILSSPEYISWLRP